MFFKFGDTNDYVPHLDSSIKHLKYNAVHTHNALKHKFPTTESDSAMLPPHGLAVFVAVAVTGRKSNVGAGGVTF